LRIILTAGVKLSLNGVPIQKMDYFSTF